MEKNRTLGRRWWRWPRFFFGFYTSVFVLIPSTGRGHNTLFMSVPSGRSVGALQCKFLLQSSLLFGLSRPKFPSESSQLSNSKFRLISKSLWNTKQKFSGFKQFRTGISGVTVVADTTRTRFKASRLQLRGQVSTVRNLLFTSFLRIFVRFDQNPRSSALSAFQLFSRSGTS